MARHHQPDLFGDAQPELFDENAAPVAYRADPSKVRERLELILSEVRAAQALPLDRSRASLYRTIVPQMTLWLPEDEAAQWLFDFETEMARVVQG